MKTENYTLTMNRQEMIRLSQACLHVIIYMEDEMNNDENCPEYRREVVLPNSIKMWKLIRKQVNDQIAAQDSANGIG
jgi:hypothetical protein